MNVMIDNDIFNNGNCGDRSRFGVGPRDRCSFLSVQVTWSELVDSIPIALSSAILQIYFRPCDLSYMPGDVPVLASRNSPSENS